MEDFDLFDLVGIAFDPPETNAKQVKKKIDQLKAELGSALGRETQQTKRDPIKAKIAYLDSAAEQILTPDGKKINTEVFNALASKKTASELEALTATAELLAVAGVHTVTEASIKHYKKESRLSLDHVKGVFSDAGFEIIDRDPLAALPKFPTNADRIYTELAALRRTNDPNPHGADSSVVDDLYSFAAYIMDDVGNIPLYKAMGTKELWGIFDPASKKYSLRNDDLGKLCGSLSTAAKTYVFNSDENRSAYDLHLVYRSEELNELFEKMRRAPEATLLNPRFADSCVKIICGYFPDYDVALAIYNKEAGFTDNFYWPATWVYTAKCSYCGTVSEFETEADALATNACQNCKRPLFKSCDKCQKAIPVSMNTCPHCGYVFASAALFAKYYQQAEMAFRKNDFDAARQYLFQAQTAAPGESARIEKLSNQIDSSEKTLKEPINKMRRLIAERRYQAARAELSKIINEFPNLNVTEFEKIITKEIDDADDAFEAARRLPTQQKADACVAVLMQCADHAPSLAYLRANPPKPCASLNVSPVSDAGTINVNWSRSDEQGVVYRLVRRSDGRGANSESDGEVLLDGSNATSFTDNALKPGKLYTYTMFTMRAGVFSAPITKSCMLFADVRNCHVVQRDSRLRITWDAPDNSSGATVFRICNGEKVTLAESAHGSFEDSTAQLGVTYTYRVCANYGGKDRSPGVELVVTPLAIIESFTIQATRLSDSECKVTWSIKQPGIDLRILVDKQLAAEAVSGDKSAVITLPGNTYCNISALAYSGGQWIDCDNSVGVNTYAACSIDKKSTRIEESMISGRNGTSYRIDLKIGLAEGVTSSVVGFYYAVRTRADNRWPTVADIGSAADIERIAYADYESRGYIPFQDFVVNETAFFVSVFTIHELNGREIVSEPARLKVERPLIANLFWSVSYGLFDGLKLHLEMEGNRPIEFVPELFLCVCDQSQFISSQDDRNAQLIMKVAECDLDRPSKRYAKTYDIGTDLPARYLKKCKYFLFEASGSGNESITLRWQQGFTGKV